MGLKIRDTDLLDKYMKANAHKRLELMMEYYPVFPCMLRKIEKKTDYSGVSAHPIRNSAHPDRASAHLMQSAL